MKKKLTVNTKIKYIDSKRYQKHFTLDDRIMIQKIITEHRDENGKLNILLKDIGNMMESILLPFLRRLSFIDYSKVDQRILGLELTILFVLISLLVLR